VRTKKCTCSVVYLLNKEARRFITYCDIIDIHNTLQARNDMLELKNEAISHVAHAEGEEFKMKILTKLARLEEEILKLRGKKREKAIEMYREFVSLLKEEPIYLKRYE